MENAKKTKKLLLGGIAVVVLIGLLTWVCLPLTYEGNRELLRDYIQSLGWGGVFVFVLLQILQIVVAVIPGEPFELIAGIIYGTWGGLFICLVGILLGQILVFLAVRRWGRPLVTRFFGEDQLAHYAFLQDESKLLTTTFILFLIPGTPKDILTYLAGLTPLRLPSFLAVSVLARIPSVITSTLAGDHLFGGNISSVAVIYTIVGILGLLGIVWNRQMLKRKNQTNKE